MRILFSTIIGTFFFISSAHAQNTVFSTKAFIDVPKQSENYTAIEYLRTQNVVKGYTDGTFKPNARINRAEFVEFIINPFIIDTNEMGDCVRGNANPNSTTVSFSDVSKDAWYAENICFAKNAKLVNGYPDGTFRPGAFINFVEATKIISDVFTLNIMSHQTGEFWYRPYVQSLSDLHAIPLGISKLGQTITRGEMAQIVYRLKVNSTTRSGMAFNERTNSLYVDRAASTVVTIPKETMVLNKYSRPSRRSIVKAAEARNVNR